MKKIITMLSSIIFFTSIFNLILNTISCSNDNVKELLFSENKTDENLINLLKSDEISIETEYDNKPLQINAENNTLAIDYGDTKNLHGFSENISSFEGSQVIYGLYEDNKYLGFKKSVWSIFYQLFGLEFYLKENMDSLESQIYFMSVKGYMNNRLFDIFIYKLNYKVKIINDEIEYFNLNKVYKKSISIY
ncbi:hypothetical protein SLITO_v1c10280 [Spiroplasma litorale]|uniref:Uncharacterized protein n=1 Tax=Spiroplasma litorale TaxID=216942 RepID=A0A0K1W2T9_9MOLU|nr:hypothetical protein [Spiroplasma litorale]AKX34639.1 hypothetical protein SLITO_v1c10280 [Spiroplasma litorale]